MSNPKTITVAGHFGDKEVTKEQFTKEWTDHVGQIRRINYDTDWQKKVDKIIMQVREAAHIEFARLYANQKSSA